MSTHPTTVRRSLAAAAIIAIATILAGCGGGPPPQAPPHTQAPEALPVVADPAAANGWSAVGAIGKLSALPAGPLYVDIEAVPAGPVPTTALRSDCMLYPTSGPQPMLDQAGNTVVTAAIMIGPDGASYPKTGKTVAADAFCLRPSAERTQGPVVSAATTIYASPDITDLTAPGTYHAQLALVDIQPGGRGGAHQHPGSETVLTTQGSVTYQLGGTPPTDLTGTTSPIVVDAGHAMTHRPDQPIQDTNTGPGPATVIAFIVWPGNQAPRMDLHHTP